MKKSRLGLTPKGAIFDIDDTLLDNNPAIPTEGLHERSRLAAAHEVGEKHGIQALIDLTPQQNLDAFLQAPVHSLEAAVWQILLMAGVADSEVINPAHPLLKEIVTRKNELHVDILLGDGKEVPGASAFVRGLAANGLDGKLAIASTGIRRDIELFLGKMDLRSLFRDDQIISRENITHPKPHPEPFLAAFASLDIPETQKHLVCAFEDDPRGVMSAKAAGLFTCAITTRYSKAHFQGLTVAPDLIAESYAEFSTIFEIA